MTASPATGDSRSTAHRPGQHKVSFDNGIIQEPEIGAVLAFSGYRFGKDDARRYDYAAIRAGNGRWYTTGDSCPPFGYTWDRLQAFLLSMSHLEAERLR